MRPTATRLDGMPGRMFFFSFLLWNSCTNFELTAKSFVGCLAAQTSCCCSYLFFHSALGGVTPACTNKGEWLSTVRHLSYCPLEARH